jgi:hypothetical protein
MDEIHARQREIKATLRRIQREDLEDELVTLEADLRLDLNARLEHLVYGHE